MEYQKVVIINKASDLYELSSLSDVFTVQLYSDFNGAKAFHLQRDENVISNFA